VSINDSTKYDKKFALITKIGRFCYSVDADLIQNSLNNQFKYENSRKRTFHEPRPYTETCFTSLKQRLITFFYKESLRNNSTEEFYMSVNSIANLKIYRIQLLDENHIMIKYTTNDYISNQQKPLVGNQNSATSLTAIVNQSLNNATNAASSSSSSTVSAATLESLQKEQMTPFYFALYDIKKAEILNVFRNNSPQLLHAYEFFQDYFTLTSLDTNFTYHTLAANNINARLVLQQNIKNIIKFNNQNDVIKYVLTQLPISSQSYSITPYLDHSLFSYDEKYISNFDRPKAIGDQIIRFNNRETGICLFLLLIFFFYLFQSKVVLVSKFIQDCNIRRNHNIQ
jgi:de-etiolated-1